MSPDLVVPVGDLIGNLGKERAFSGSHTVRLRLGGTVLEGPMTVSGVVRGLNDGVTADFEAAGEAFIECVRCLTRWSETVVARGSQVYQQRPDEDGYGVVDDEIDLAGPAMDELSLALPAAPLCMSDCRGLCPTCGTDLNTEPCDGHEDDSDSPFAVLRDLFDS